MAQVVQPPTSIETRLVPGQAPPVTDPVRVRWCLPDREHPRTKRLQLNPLTSDHGKRAAILDKMQQQMMANIEKVSPESLMQSWFTFDPKIAERFQDMFVTMAGLGGMTNKDKK